MEFSIFLLKLNWSGGKRELLLLLERGRRDKRGSAGNLGKRAVQGCGGSERKGGRKDARKRTRENRGSRMSGVEWSHKRGENLLGRRSSSGQSRGLKNGTHTKLFGLRGTKGKRRRSSRDLGFGKRSSGSLGFLEGGCKRGCESGTNEAEVITERILGLVRGHGGSDLGHDGDIGRATGAIETVVRHKRIFLLLFLFEISEGFVVHTIGIFNHNTTQSRKKTEPFRILVVLRAESSFGGSTTTTGFKPLVDLFRIHGDGHTNLLLEMGGRVLGVVFVDPLEATNLQDTMDDSTFVDTTISAISQPTTNLETRETSGLHQLLKTLFVLAIVDSIPRVVKLFKSTTLIFIKPSGHYCCAMMRG